MPTLLDVKDIGSIAIIGAGAVGLYYGGRLAEAGHEVHFHTRSDAAALRSLGLRVRSHHGDFTIPSDRIHAWDDPRRMPRADWVISTLKSTAKPDYAELIKPLLKRDTPIVALQNGLGNEEELARHFGAERVLGGIAYVCIHRKGEGIIDHSAQGDLKIGEFGRPATDRALSLVEQMREAKIQASTIDDLKYHRWHKQVWNVAFNGLGALLDLDCAQLLATEAGRDSVRRVMRDVLRAAASVGVHFEESLIEYQIERTTGVGAYKTSMHLDRLAGRTMEIEAIIGEPIRAAEAAGVTDLAALSSLYPQLKAIESSRAF